MCAGASASGGRRWPRSSAACGRGRGSGRAGGGGAAGAGGGGGLRHAASGDEWQRWNQMDDISLTSPWIGTPGSGHPVSLIGTPLNARNSPHLSSLSQHRHPRTMVWRTMLVTVSTSFLLGPCPAAAARDAQLTRVRRDNVYPLDCRPQRSLAIARHDRGHQPLHQILLPAGVGSKWTGVGVYRRRACSAAQCWRPVHQGVPRKQRGGSVRRRKSWYVFHPQSLAHV